MPEPLINAVRGRTPQIHPEAWVAPNAFVIGQVTLAARSSVWCPATMRAEAEPIHVGAGTNIPDSVTVHVGAEYPVRVGAGSLIAAGALVSRGWRAPPRSLVTGCAGASAATRRWRPIATMRAFMNGCSRLHRVAL
jgi:carbonic anhydrase/acetyltransferase-like protein (isoleucine patch superfamily)